MISPALVLRNYDLWRTAAYEQITVISVFLAFAYAACDSGPGDSFDMNLKGKNTCRVLAPSAMRSGAFILHPL